MAFTHLETANSTELIQFQKVEELIRKLIPPEESSLNFSTEACLTTIILDYPVEISIVGVTKENTVLCKISITKNNSSVDVSSFALNVSELNNKTLILLEQSLYLEWGLRRKTRNTNLGGSA
jgi:hypothetical protein